MKNKNRNVFENSMEIPIVDPNLAQGYQAICNGHPGGWYGPCRTASADANDDKINHDNNSHSGDSWAMIVKRTCQ